MIIGIDPGQNTGIAIYDNGWTLLTVPFWGAIFELSSRISEKPKVFIEDPNLIKPTFPRKVGPRVRDKISQSVGMNKRDAQLLIRWCELRGLDVTHVKPTRSKVDAKYFKKLTGYSKRCSQHARDSAMLIVGRTWEG